MLNETKNMPAGTALLVSALVIYPAFTAINVDVDKREMRFDFQFNLEEGDTREKYDKMVANLERCLLFTQKLLGIKPAISQFSSTITGRIYVTNWRRDMDTLGESEVDTIHELLLDFCEEQNIEVDEGMMDTEQYFHFGRMFEDLFRQIQSMDHSVRLRAYRDMGMIFVQKLPVG